MKLSDSACRSAKAKEKDYKLSDGNGMYLLVRKNGTKCWRMKYRFAGKEKTMVFGVYPEVSLKVAREKRDEVKKTLNEGTDPSLKKKEEKIQEKFSNSLLFEDIAREWHEMKSVEWSQRRIDRVIKTLEADIFPYLGQHPIGEISALTLLTVLRSIEERGAYHTATRTRGICSRIFKYAIATGRAERDVAVDLVGALKSKKEEHHKYLQENDLPEFFQKLETLKCAEMVRIALNLMILTFPRTTELRAAMWDEFNFDKNEWRIPAERMKMERLHIIPLSHQSISFLKDLKKITGYSDYLFPNRNTKGKNPFMTENAMLYALYRMGYKGKATVHGFRSTASTILNENGFYSDVIERQLAHLEGNKVRASYNHAEYLPERRKMMQWYADYLDKLKASQTS